MNFQTFCLYAVAVLVPIMAAAQEPVDAHAQLGVLTQPAGSSVDGRYLIGFDNVKRNSTGKLTIADGALQFQASQTNSRICIASIEDIAVGRETTQAGGKAGTVAKTAAIAAPYDSGAGLSILLRTNVDILTVSSRDSNGSLHDLILALPKGQAEIQRAQLVALGARVTEPSREDLMENGPAAPEVPTASRQKFAASAVQIEPPDDADVQIPAEFRAAVYEFLVNRVRESGAFHQVFRSGDRAAAGVLDLVTLRITVDKFKQGSQMTREITTVLGATKLDVSASLIDRSGHVVLNGHVHGKVRFFGENLGVTDDLAKRIAKLLKQG